MLNQNPINIFNSLFVALNNISIKLIVGNSDQYRKGSVISFNSARTYFIGSANATQTQGIIHSHKSIVLSDTSLLEFLTGTVASKKGVIDQVIITQYNTNSEESGYAAKYTYSNCCVKKVGVFHYSTSSGVPHWGMFFIFYTASIEYSGKDSTLSGNVAYQGKVCSAQSKSSN
ncbi:hypothetical protein AB837_00133 [bacterium AB1]|nr:hypothetical protein AB837_00133 [bacterium AB1]